ncbi:MAG TPA: septum formation initiator family protein [Gaiellales bacterium]|nr:septum formation initiator family protein [Gaiellales bacterium]
MSIAVPARRRTAVPHRTPAPVPAPAAPVRPRRGQRARPRRLRAGGVVWLVALAVLFGGIVAVQVTALRANIAVGRLNAQAAQLHSQNQLLAAEVADLQSSYRIGFIARRLGMVREVPARNDFLTLPHRDHRRPITRPQSPAPSVKAAPAR